MKDGQPLAPSDVSRQPGVSSACPGTNLCVLSAQDRAALPAPPPLRLHCCTPTRRPCLPLPAPACLQRSATTLRFTRTLSQIYGPGTGWSFSGGVMRWEVVMGVGGGASGVDGSFSTAVARLAVSADEVAGMASMVGGSGAPCPCCRASRCHAILCTTLHPFPPCALCSIVGKRVDSSKSKNFLASVTADAARGDTRLRVRVGALQTSGRAVRGAFEADAAAGLELERHPNALCSFSVALLPASSGWPGGPGGGGGGRRAGVCQKV